MYHFINKLHTLYGLLQDEQSKEIFQARFAIDMEPSIPNLKHLASLGYCKLGCTQSQQDVLRKLNQEQKKIILYGPGYTGREIAKILEGEHIDFYGFCGQDAERFPDGLLGKPVLSPDELIAHRDEYYIMLVVRTRKSYTEISKFLQEHNYPKDHLLDWVDRRSFDEAQYFEFPALYRRGTTFIDGGCYDCENSYEFARWCEGAYSSIIAFEPDPDNYAKCCTKVRNVPLPNFQLINAALSSQEGTAVFDAQHNVRSRIIPSGIDSKKNETNISSKVSIRTVAIDNIAGDNTVGFIKMDIEGAELDALRGAKNTIIQDKPLLAICVYHLQGDVFAIMDYLHQLVPEYRYLLRHYGTTRLETVLYASVDL